MESLISIACEFLCTEKKAPSNNFKKKVRPVNVDFFPSFQSFPTQIYFHFFLQILTTFSNYKALLNHIIINQFFFFLLTTVLNLNVDSRFLQSSFFTTILFSTTVYPEHTHSTPTQIDISWKCRAPSKKQHFNTK